MPTPYDILDILFRRFIVIKSEMPTKYKITCTIYHGMGDFTDFEAESTTLDGAVKDIVAQYLLERDLTEKELNERVQAIWDNRGKK